MSTSSKSVTGNICWLLPVAKGRLIVNFLQPSQNVWIFSPTSASQITVRGLDWVKSTRTLLPKLGNKVLVDVNQSNLGKKVLVDLNRSNPLTVIWDALVGQKMQTFSIIRVQNKILLQKLLRMASTVKCSAQLIRQSVVLTGTRAHWDKKRPLGIALSGSSPPSYCKFKGKSFVSYKIRSFTVTEKKTVENRKLKRFFGDRKSSKDRKTHSLKPLGISLKRFHVLLLMKVQDKNAKTKQH